MVLRSTERQNQEPDAMRKPGFPLAFTSRAARFRRRFMLNWPTSSMAPLSRLSWICVGKGCR